ncbi:MAG: tetratricopeptide repeat protein [Gammaproteobacteria bacterium]|nr:tetratricopeptide repeat protein [Gammaproteobacteria bacterium]
MKPARNGPCPCGSGRKYKQCCGRPVAADLPSPQLAELVRLLESGQAAEAEAQAAVRLESEPQSGPLWKLVSVARLRQGKDALEALSRAASLLPDDPEAQANLGSELRSRGQWEAALASLRRSLTLNPRNPDALLEAAEVQRALGRLPEALLLLQWALPLAPQRIEIHNNLGNLLLALGRPAEAVACYRRALQLQPTHAQVLANLANALRESGQLDEALACCQRALELDPQLALAHNNLGLLRGVRGERTAALQSFRAALQAQPVYPEALFNLGTVLHELGAPHDALAAYEQGIAQAPTRAEGHEYLGRTLLELRRPAEATASFTRALELRPHHPGTLTGLAAALRAQRRHADAEQACRQALERAPEHPEALSLLGEILADHGRFEEAESLLRRALAADPHYVPPYAHLAANRRLTRDDGAWLGGVQELLRRPLTLSERIHLQFVLGKYHDDIEEYDQAFAAYREAHELSKQLAAPYQPERMQRLVERVIALHRALPATGPARGEPPVLIIGMPRSGTSLVEQILASHPGVYGAGEVRFWDAAFGRLRTANEAGADLAPLLATIAQEYLAALGAGAPAAALRMTDKMPANFLYAGLIAAALPGARFIHVVRDPLDTCLSVYCQNFLNAAPYAHDLEWLAHFYTQYRRLMAYWRDSLPPDSLLEVPYEGLVSDPEQWTRRMLEFIGLPWDPRCLEFHRTERVVITASKWQVRQRLHAGAVGRWRHYERHLEALRPLAAAPADSAA